MATVFHLRRFRSGDARLRPARAHAPAGGGRRRSSKGRRERSRLLEQGQTLAGEQKLGAAKMLMQAARAAGIAGWDRLGETDHQSGAPISGGADVGW